MGSGVPWQAQERAGAVLRRARDAWSAAGLDPADLADLARAVLAEDVRRHAPPVAPAWVPRSDLDRVTGELDAERHRRQLAEARARCYLDELDDRDGLGCHAGPVAEGPQLIPCPVCGGELRYGAWPLLDGDGLTEVMVDCPQRHHATTDPHEWERLRRDAVSTAYRAAAQLLASEDEDPADRG